MNRRLHLMRRIHFMKQHVRSKDMLRFLEQTYNVLEADEEEITDMLSRMDMLERQYHGLIPPLPDSDVTLNNRDEEDEDDEDDENKKF
jgi:hypothetical protein